MLWSKAGVVGGAFLSFIRMIMGAITSARNVTAPVIQSSLIIPENKVMMTDSMLASVKALIVSHEGRREFPYVDTVGKITVGIGYNLTDRGMTDTWINSQFQSDVDFFYKQLHEDFNWFASLNEARQMALIDMCFMGYKRFCEFKDMLYYLSTGNYGLAADAMLNSEWATQVKGRATQLAQMVLTGEM